MRPIKDIGSWKQSGRLFVWRFTDNVRNFPGWHYMLDSTGSKSIAGLLHAMSKSATSCIRVVQVSQPTTEVLRVPSNRGAACLAPTKLRIELDSTDPSAWSLDDDGVALHWRLGSDTAAVAADAFENPSKFFDSSIGAGPPLWCWGLLRD
jgi:hypothetical protein